MTTLYYYKHSWDFSGLQLSYLEIIWPFWVLLLNLLEGTRAVLSLGPIISHHGSKTFCVLYLMPCGLWGFSVWLLRTGTSPHSLWVQALSFLIFLTFCFVLFLFLSSGSFLIHMCWSVFSWTLNRDPCRCPEFSVPLSPLVPCPANFSSLGLPRPDSAMVLSPCATAWIFSQGSTLGHLEGHHICLLSHGSLSFTVRCPKSSKLSFHAFCLLF